MAMVTMCKNCGHKWVDYEPEKCVMHRPERCAMYNAHDDVVKWLDQLNPGKFVERAHGKKCRTAKARTPELETVLCPKCQKKQAKLYGCMAVCPDCGGTKIPERDTEAM